MFNIEDEERLLDEVPSTVTTVMSCLRHSVEAKKLRRRCYKEVGNSRENLEKEEPRESLETEEVRERSRLVTYLLTITYIVTITYLLSYLFTYLFACLFTYLL